MTPLARADKKQHYSTFVFATALLVLAAWAVHPATAEIDDDARRSIDELFAPWDRWDSPGAALAVTQNGEMVYKRGYGSAQLEYNVPITPSTVFHVASVSKQFTNFALALLASEGKLSLDDDIRSHVPEVPDFGPKITLRHLIHHTSGLRDQWELLLMGGWRFDDVITTEHILKMVSRQRELNFEPGSEYLYCNTGYTLLAQVVARASGQSFPEFTAERIFRPLGMSRTHFHDDHLMIVANRAYSYGSKGAGFEKNVLSYANAGATSLFTTAEDLSRWLHNLDTGDLGGQALRDQMHQRGVLNDGEELSYAFGLSHGEYRGTPTVSHGGADAGFRSFALRLPTKGMGVVVLSNHASFDAGGLATRVAELLVEDLEPAPADPPAAAPKRVRLMPEQLRRFAGRYSLDVGIVATLLVERGRLMIEAAGFPKAELVPTSAREFVVEELGSTLVFSDTNKDITFVAATPQGRVEGTRLAEIDTSLLTPVFGTYYSAELDTTYRLLEHQGQTIARHQRHPDVVLLPLSPTELAGDRLWFGRARVEIDEGGAVKGFRLSGGRVRNLWFERVPEPMG